MSPLASELHVSFRRQVDLPGVHFFSDSVFGHQYIEVFGDSVNEIQTKLFKLARDIDAAAFDLGDRVER